MYRQVWLKGFKDLFGAAGAVEQGYGFLLTDQWRRGKKKIEILQDPTHCLIEYHN